MQKYELLGKICLYKVVGNLHKNMILYILGTMGSEKFKRKKRLQLVGPYNYSMRPFRSSVQLFDENISCIGAVLYVRVIVSAREIMYARTAFPPD